MNIDVLLEPISADVPCGVDLSFSREFDAVRESRREDDATLDQGEWKRPLKEADWAGTVALCEALLRTRSKDLRIAVWLADALGRTNGFAGLADGLTLCARLCETFWSDLHPLPEDGDQSPRTGSLNWLLGQIVELAGMAPVIRDAGKGLGLRDIEAARALQQAVDRGTTPAATAAAKGRPTLDEVARVQAATPRGFLVSNRAFAQRAVDALAQLQAFVDVRLGEDGPAFAFARRALEDALARIERLAREGGATAEPAPAAVPDAASASVADAHDPSAAEPVAPGTSSSASGPLRNRADALAQLRAVAEFFRRTEPHSPVAYLADKAARWGEMPLHDWLRAVVKDPGVLAQVEEQLGVPPLAPMQ